MSQPSFKVFAQSIDGDDIAMEKFETRAEADSCFDNLTDPETTPLLAYGGGTVWLFELHRGDWSPVTIRTVVP